MIKKQGIYPVAGIFLFLALFLNICSSHAESIQTVAIIKLYSDGKLAETWKAVDKGKPDGSCYVFHVRKGARENEIRVCGTYSVEQLR